MTMARCGFPLPMHKVSYLAYQYAQLNGIRGFSDVTKRAGRSWCDSFMKRHPIIRKKKFKNLSRQRAISANPANIKLWFDKLERVMKENDITEPDQVGNADETGTQNVPKEGGEVIGVTGEVTWQQVDSEKGETTSILGAAVADGLAAPPMIIFKGAKVHPAWLDKIPNHWMVRCSQTGWINADLFYDFAEHYVAFLHRKKILREGRKHLLLLDSHKSHIHNIKFFDLMKRNNVVVLAIPPHTSHVTQPLDSVPFSLFKRFFNKNLLTWIVQTSCGSLSKEDYFDVFYPSWYDSMNGSAIRGGFKKTGIWPVSFENLPKAKMTPSAVTDQLAGRQSV